MKLLLLALVAVASAEPESFWPYTTAYNGFNTYYPTTAGVYNGYTAGVYNYPSVYNYGLRTFAKRDADADAFHHYSPYVYNTGLYQPYTYGYRSGIHATVSEPVLKQGNFHTNLRNALKGVHTAPVGQVYQSTFNTIVKRDAESESFYPTYYNGYQYPTVYNTAGVYSYPSVYTSGLYNAYNPYRFVKRDAEADSDSFYPTVYNAGFYNYQYPTASYYNAYSPVRSVFANQYYNGLRYY